MPQFQSTIERKLDPLSHLYMATGDPALTRIAQARKTLQRGDQWISLGNGVLYNTRTGESRLDPKYAEQEQAQRAHERDLKGLAFDARKELEQEKTRRKAQKAQTMPEATHRKVAEKQAETRLGKDLLRDYDTAIASGEQVVEPIAGLVPGALREKGFQGTANVYEQVTDTPAAINLRSRIEGLVGPYRKFIMGTAQTGTEAANWDKANPLATGISQEESRARVQRMVTWYETTGESLAAGRKAPGMAAAPQPAPSTPSTPRKTEIYPGSVVDGWRFRGGDPSNQSNWEQVE